MRWILLPLQLCMLDPWNNNKANIFSFKIPISCHLHVIIWENTLCILNHLRLKSPRSQLVTMTGQKMSLCITSATLVSIPQLQF